MLPNPLYQSLPYLYIIAGVLLALVIESDIVLAPTLLLMFTGSLVLWMRHRPLADSSTGSVSEVQSLKSRNWNDIFQAEQERRLLGTTRTFPLIDNQGNMISFDRRVGKRRKVRAA